MMMEGATGMVPVMTALILPLVIILIGIVATLPSRGTPGEQAVPSTKPTRIMILVHELLTLSLIRPCRHLMILI
jgi:hypothetical protein